MITDGGQVVAEIAPPRGQPARLADAGLADAVRQGWLTPPALGGGVPPRKPVMTFDDLMAALRRDREGG